MEDNDLDSNPFKDKILEKYPDAVIIGNDNNNYHKRVLTLTPNQFLLANEIKYDILRNILSENNNINILNLHVLDENSKLGNQKQNDIGLLSFENNDLKISLLLKSDFDNNYFLRKHLSIVYTTTIETTEVNFPVYDFYSPVVYFDIIINNFRKDYSKLLEEYNSFNKPFLDDYAVSLLLKDDENYNNIKNILQLMGSYSSSQCGDTDHIRTLIRLLVLKMKLSLPILDMRNITLLDNYEKQILYIGVLNLNHIYNVPPKICSDNDLLRISTSFFNYYHDMFYN